MTILKKGERLDTFPGNELTLIQSDEAFAVSSDSLFLASFVHLRKTSNQKLLDLCTGNAIIPLLLSERTQAKMDGIELQEEIADRAKRTIQLNHKQDQITIHQGNIRHAKENFPPNSFQVMTCNPPYFKKHEDSSLNPNQAKAIARHEIEMVLEDVFIQAKALLKSMGKLYIVHRPDRLNELFYLGFKHHLPIKALQFCRPKEGKEANLVLIECLKDGQLEGTKVLEDLIVHDSNGQYTPRAWKSLTGEHHR